MLCRYKAGLHGVWHGKAVMTHVIRHNYSCSHAHGPRHGQSVVTVTDWVWINKTSVTVTASVSDRSDVNDNVAWLADFPYWSSAS